MARRVSRKKGDGITKRTVTEYITEAPEELLEALSGWKIALDEPLAPLRSEIEVAKAAYKEWQDQNSGKTPDSETIPGLLRDVSKFAAAMEKALNEGRAEWAMRWAAEIGETVALLMIKHDWEPAAEHGRSRLDNLAASRDKHNLSRANNADRMHRQWQEEAEGIWSRQPALTKSSVAKILADKSFPESSPNTIRQKIKKPDDAG